MPALEPPMIRIRSASCLRAARRSAVWRAGDIPRS